jgi:iron uptake system component EfeO
MPSARIRRGAGLIAAAALAASLAGCGSDDSSTPATGSADDTGAPGSPSSSTTTEAAGDTGAGQVDITMANAGGSDTCTLDTDSAAAGPVTFSVTNESATGVTEVELLQDQKILGEKENLAPGLSAVEFTVTLGGGDYQIYCPGADPEMVPFTVTGEAATEPAGDVQQDLQDGATQYATYVDDQVASMVQGARALQTAVDGGDLATAQDAYAKARIFYERIESDVDGFVLDGFPPTDNHGNLDYLIDMRGSNLDPAVGWHGFHAVERDLFGRRKITGSTKQLAGELSDNVTKLSTLAATLTYKPEDLANGAAGLLEEVQANKITGEEEEFSHIDLVDFAGNVEGAQQSFAYLKPGLEQIDGTLTDTIAQRFDTVTALLDTYRDPHALGGYQLYTAELRRTDANKLSQSVQALQDSLSRLAEKVATA